MDFPFVAQDSLDLKEGQEEAFVIRASGNKLLEARIDQLRQVVTITKIARQTFTAAQWQELRAQLASWKVSTMLCPQQPQLISKDCARCCLRLLLLCDAGKCMECEGPCQHPAG